MSRPVATDLFDDEVRYAQTLEGFGPKAIVQVLTFHGVLSAIGFGLGWWLPTTRPAHAGSMVGVVAALVVQAPLVWLSSRLFAARRREVFWVAHSAMTMAFFAWLGLLLWESPGFYGAILAALYGVWGYHDAWTAGGARMRRLYLLAAPTMDFALLGLDLAGGKGPMWAWVNERPALLAFFAVQVVLTACVQWLIQWVDAEVRERDRLAAAHAEVASRLAAIEREREVVQGSCELLTTGLIASKYSHDLASPLTVMRLDVETLAEVVRGMPADPTRDRLVEIVEELHEVTEQVTGMTAGMAQAVRAPDVVAPASVRELCAQAEVGMRAALRGHAVAVPPLEVTPDDTLVLLGRGHAGTLANLLANAALAAPGLPITVSGGVVEGRFRLRVRDRGVSGEAREEARRRIEAMLHLQHPPDGERVRRGYGVALLLARVYLLRHGGGLDVEFPADGPGLVFVLDLPLPSVEPA